MAKKRGEIARIQRNALSAEEAERLFGTVDETGHTNEETARSQRRRRGQRGQGVDIDPLSDADPSGSNVEKVITRTAITFVIVLFVAVVALQVVTTVVRHASTANLAEDVNITNVATALQNGVEWGNGFTQFPTDYSVQEADENTHRIEVTVTDTSSKNALEAFSGAQIQAAAFSVNALLNPNINTVVYHVNVYEDENGKIQDAHLLGLVRPSGSMKTLMTFVWTKTTTVGGGVRFNCIITGLDDATAAQLQKAITSDNTPQGILSSILGNDGNDTTTTKVDEDDGADPRADGSSDGSSGTDASAKTPTTSQNQDTSLDASQPGGR